MTCSLEQVLAHVPNCGKTSPYPSEFWVFQIVQAAIVFPVTTRGLSLPAIFDLDFDTGQTLFKHVPNEIDKVILLWAQIL